VCCVACWQIRMRLFNCAVVSSPLVLQQGYSRYSVHALSELCRCVSRVRKGTKRLFNCAVVSVFGLKLSQCTLCISNPNSSFGLGSLSRVVDEKEMAFQLCSCQHITNFNYSVFALASLCCSDKFSS
jgi:hypothetical protein